MPSKALEVLSCCEKLSERCRNELAHQLVAFSQEQFYAACGTEPAQLLRELGELIELLYDECDPALFSIYLICGKYIKGNLN